MQTFIEYRVKPVTRYIVTRYESQMSDDRRSGSTGPVSERGEFPNFDTAYAVGYALCKAEHEQLGYPLDDERIKYPDCEPDDRLSRARFYRKLADELQAMDAQERYRLKNPDAFKAQAAGRQIGGATPDRFPLVGQTITYTVGDETNRWGEGLSGLAEAPDSPIAAGLHPHFGPGDIIPADKIAILDGESNEAVRTYFTDCGLAVGRRLDDGSVRIEAMLALGTPAAVTDALVDALEKAAPDAENPE